MAVRIIAAGDSFITRRLPEKGYEGFEELAGLIRTFDAAFVNLESTFQWHEGTPAATSGGTWAMSPPTLTEISSVYCQLPTLSGTITRTLTTSPSCRVSSKTLRLPAMTRSTTAYPVALRPNWPSSKTRSLGVPTARLPRTGRTSWARRRLLPFRLRRGPGSSIVKRLATASSCPVTRFCIQLANCNCSHRAFLNHNEKRVRKNAPNQQADLGRLSSNLRKDG